MNKKQTIVSWIGAAFFVLCAWNPRETRQSMGGIRIVYYYFDRSLTALIGRLSSTVVVTGLAVYTLRDKKPKDEQ